MPVMRLVVTLLAAGTLRGVLAAAGRLAHLVPAQAAKAAAQGQRISA